MGSHGGYNIISRVGVVKKGGGAADPRSIFLSLFFARFSLSPPPPPSRAAPLRHRTRIESKTIESREARGT